MRSASSVTRNLATRNAFSAVTSEPQTKRQNRLYGIHDDTLPTTLSCPAITAPTTVGIGERRLK